jgi:putative ABC transport system permease protein
MRDVAVEGGRATIRIVLGGLITALGVLALFGGLFGSSDNALALVGTGAVLTILGVAALGPLFARPVSRLLGAPLPRIKGVTGALARENAMRNPRRTSTTAAALMIGVALVAFITIFAASTKASYYKAFDKQFTGDLVIDSGAQNFGGVSPKLASQLRALPQLDAVASFRIARVQFDGNVTQLAAYDATPLTKITDIGVRAGSMSDLGASGLAVNDEKARKRHWRIGTTVPVKFPATGLVQLTIRVIYHEKNVAGNPSVDFFVDNRAFDVGIPDQLDSQVYATLAKGVSITEGRRAVAAVAKAYPNAKVQDRSQYKAAQGKQLDQLLGLVYALLFLAILIALLGITNTLVLSIVERTRELGLLRAVGMTRRQMKSMVRWESVLIALFGTIGGLGVGLFFGWAMVRALADQGFDVFVIPVGSLILISVLAALAGVLAAVLPARRAARLDILRAIATD